MAAGMKPKAWGGAPKRSDYMSRATMAPTRPNTILNRGAWDKLVESQGKGGSSVSAADLASAGKPTIRQGEFDQAGFDTATTDYDTAMKDMREDAADYVSEWSNKMAPAPGRTGQAREAPAQLMASAQAPVDEGALYGVPGDPISSIVNLKKKRRA
jgi:hypothetical protein